jgi:uncharacterized protein (DUF2252 family)
VCVMDAAYWCKGCSSLGRLRLAVLVAVGSGKAERHCLMDVKEATAAAAPRSKTADMPHDKPNGWSPLRATCRPSWAVA